jgi:hypothetical protein
LASKTSVLTSDELPKFFLEAFKLYTTVEPLIDRVAKLEAKAGSSLKYLGVYKPDAIYSEQSPSS